MNGEQDSRPWIQPARDLLRRARGGEGWGYRTGSAPAVEPTALASLALLPEGGADPEILEAARWVAALQRPDGSVPVGKALPEPGWPTPLAVLLWSAVGGFAQERRRACAWMLEAKGTTLERGPDLVVEHDTTLVGWPWVLGTSAWVEPTAMAILALTREGQVQHPRVREGTKLLLDRALSAGGWNYGNTVVFGATLRPQPVPTGWALMALAAASAGGPEVTRGLAFLEASLPPIRSAQSLGWGLLGLEAWKRRPAEADAWLARAFEVSGGPEEASRAAVLLLAQGGRRSLDLLGVPRGGP